MSTTTQPTYYQDVQVQCICGNSFSVNAAVEGPIKIESCPACHPVYTGKKESKVVKGRMEKFLEKQKRMQALQQQH
jgi:large subunit ribosomal protein L31